jgi:hypothetical protein
MFALYGKEFDEKNNPEAAAGGPGWREDLLKGSVYDGWDVCAISVGELPPSFVRRHVAAAVGSMYVSQLAVPSHRFASPVLLTGFTNGAESVVCGSPAIMFCTVIYGQPFRSPGRGGHDWSLLVQERMAANQTTPLRALLQIGPAQMVESHYAEGWSLVALLNRQPAQFGKLLQVMSKGSPGLTAIKKVYGWDESRLAKEWRAYVLGQK